MVDTGCTLLLPELGFRSRTLGRDVALVVGFSLLTAVSARLSVHLPFTPVPITGQTFAVLLTGALLGGGRGFGAMLLYLAEGLAGLPVFAPGPGPSVGPAAFLGPTGGYLMAFPLAALAVGLLAERGWDRTPVRMLAAMAIGSGIIYLLGAGWLSRFVGGPAAAIAQGVAPFLPGDVLKAALAAGSLPLGWRLVGRKNLPDF
jgi:biotin transport system substrate-specific component